MARASERPKGVDPFLGQVLQERYRIVRLIGEGGMGAVYEGLHLLIKKRVAIKLLHERVRRSEKHLKRFQNEAIAATAIGHPNIIDVIDFGHLPDGSAFMVLEYLEGEDFESVIAREGAQPLGRTARILLQACGALEAAHARGIVHRDLKPENLFLVRREDGSELVKVLDFGIAKFTDDEGMRMTQTGQAMGTPYYMAPEQLLGHSSVDARADLYAIGVLLFHALTDTFPFEADVFAQLVLKVTQDAPPPLDSVRPDLPPEVSALVGRLLAKRPENRPESIAEVREVLARVRDFEGAPRASEPRSGRRMSSHIETVERAAGVAAGELTGPLVGAGRSAPASDEIALGATVSGIASGAPVEIRVSRAPDEPGVTAPPAAAEPSSGPAPSAELAPEPAHAARPPRAAPARLLTTVPPAEIPGMRARTLSPAVLGVVLALAAIGAGVAWSAWSSAPAATSAASAPPRTVHISIATDPPDAELLLDGEPISNPFDAQLEPRARPHRLEARREGYLPVSRMVSLRVAQHVPLVLRPLPSTPSAAPAPAAAPTLAPEPAPRIAGARGTKRGTAAGEPVAALPPPAPAPPSAPAAAPAPAPPAASAPPAGEDLLRVRFGARRAPTPESPREAQ